MASSGERNRGLASQAARRPRRPASVAPVAPSTLEDAFVEDTGPLGAADLVDLRIPPDSLDTRVQVDRIEELREDTRRRTVKYLMYLLALTIGISGAAVFTGQLEARDFLETIFSPLVAATTGALGFYFGTEKKR